MKLGRCAYFVIAALVALEVGCAAPAAAPTKSSEQTPGPPNRTLVLIRRSEPTTSAIKGIPFTESDSRITYFDAGLTYVGDQDIAYPYLATELPRLNTDSWKVMPDGRMETTYRLKPAAVWHDGTPLSAEDFAFAGRVYATVEFGWSKSDPMGQIEEVRASDPATVVIRWRRPFPDADRVTATGLPPLPKHILQDPFERAPEAFQNLDFWRNQYVGLGPWRLDRWEQGAFVEGVAFDRHVLGRPKIDRLKLIWNSDSNAVLSTLLAGEAQLSEAFAIFPEQGAVLKQQGWAGTVLAVPNSWRKIDVQVRPEFVNPRALLDVRVRRAFAHAIDRNPIIEAIYLGESIVTDTSVFPTDSYYQEAQKVIARYPYDLRKTEQLMSEAGFTKGPDGVYVSSTDGRISVELRANQPDSLIKEASIIAGNWRQAGFEASERAAAAPEAANSQFRGSFPSFYAGTGGVFSAYTKSEVSSPLNNWVGRNRGGWSSPDFDRFYEIFALNLDRSARDKAAVEMARIQSEEVPSISLVYLVSSIAIGKGLSGPAPWGAGSSLTWNMYLWEWK